MRGDLAGADPVEGVDLSFWFPAPDGEYAVRVEARFGEHHLSLFDARAERTVEWGWVDCHHMPDALRPAEFEMLAGRIAGRHPPAWAVGLLLAWYVPLTVGSVGAMRRRVRGDLYASRLFAASEVEYILEQYGAHPRAGVQWVWDDESGWVVAGPGAASLRTAGQPVSSVVRAFFAALGVP